MTYESYKQAEADMDAHRDYLARIYKSDRLICYKIFPEVKTLTFKEMYGYEIFLLEYGGIRIEGERKPIF
jgi:hypothetical protein